MSPSHAVYQFDLKYESRLLYLKYMVFTTNPELFLETLGLYAS